MAFIGLLTLTTHAKDNTFGVKGDINFSNFYTENVDGENVKRVSILEFTLEVNLYLNFYTFRLKLATPAKALKLKVMEKKQKLDWAI